MKFGKTFTSHQVPEWSHYYMNYKDLKKQIKALVLAEQLAEDPGDPLNDPQVKSLLAQFFFSLDRSIEKVDDFFNKQYAEYDRRLKRLTATLGNSTDHHQMDDEEIDEVIGILLELRNNFRNLKWFGELNKRGFIKILKKLDKKTGTDQQKSYLNARVNALSFANELDILKSLSIINSYLNKWGPQIVNVDSSNTSPLLSSVMSTSVSASTSGSTPDQLLLSKMTPVDRPTQSIDSTLQNTNNTKIDKYLLAIAENDADKVTEELIKDYRSPVLAPLKLLISLLNKSALLKSFKIIDLLLEIIPILGDNTDISGRNFFHHHVIALGKQSAHLEELAKEQSKYSTIAPATPPDVNSRLITAFGSDGVNSNDSPAGLFYIFEHLPPHLKFGILQKDNYRRTPLHYAAQYGLKDVTQVIIDYLQKWNLWNENISIDDVNVWGDSELLTPLHLSVLGTHPKTTEVLISAMKPDVKLCSPRLFLIATRLNSPELLNLLLGCNGIDINFFDPDSHETALYISCKLNLIKSVQFLLEHGADTEIGEMSFGWTPIFIAASEGLLEVIQLLIAKGANYQVSDESGWSPMEHATLRGQLKVAELLKPANYDPSKVLLDSYTYFPPIANGSSTTSTPSLNSSLSNLTVSKHEQPPRLYSQNHVSSSSIDKLPQPIQTSPDSSQLFKSLKNNGNQRRSTSPPFPVKSFGHRYLQENESLILVTLGTTDLRDTQLPITLNRVPLAKAYSTELDTALSLVVRAKDYEDPPVVIDLPLDDVHGGATDPISFKCVNGDPLQTTIYFDIVPTYAYGENKEQKNSKVVGRAVALLNTAYTQVGKNRRSLSNVITVPILENETLEVLGTVRFEFMLVTPFKYSKMVIGPAETYWKSLVSTRVIGHRGLGKNSNDRKSLQLGENTVESFIAAASLGASYVEFDVQLTKDNIPVVYHDFIVAESGMDIPMHEMTAEQFLGLNQEQEKNDRLSDGKAVDDEILHTKYRRSKSLSHRLFEKEEEDQFNERMKLTRTWKANGFKGNSRGHSIASSFATLLELFKKIPKNIGFNIECKYPMLDEAQFESIGEIAFDMNFWVDTVLKVVFEHADGRDIIFSSFHPDICVLLSLKQPSIPILYLTESGTLEMADVRAASLQAAIRFAKKWNLLGIVSAADPLISCPRLTNVIKSSGLVCVTYGTSNNIPENANLQMLAGVDAVIVDSVLAVRKGLRKEGAESENGSTSTLV